MENSAFSKINNLDKMVEFECKDNIEVYKKVIFEPIRIGPVSTLDEMDLKVLQFQNKKLEMKLEEYQRVENELQQRIQQLEKRQSQDKTVLNVVNTYWNQLNDDIGAVLLDVDDEYENDSEHHIESETALNFINELTTWDETQIDEKLMNNVQISTSAMAKIIRAYDHVLLKNDKTLSSIKLQTGDDPSINMSNNVDVYTDSKVKHKLKSTDNQDKRLQKIRNHDSSCSSDNKDTKRIKLAENTETLSDSNENDITPKSVNERTDSDIVTDSIKETTSFTKIFSTHFDNSDKVTCNNSVNNLERASNGDSSAHPYNHHVTVISNVKSIESNEDDGRSYNEIKSILREIIDKVEENSKNVNADVCRAKPAVKTFQFFNEPADKNFEEYDCISDRIKAYVDEYKEKHGDVLVDDSKKILNEGNDRIVDKELKNLCVEVTHDNVRLQNIISTFQNQQQKIIANDQKITEDLNSIMKESEKWRIRVDDIEYENEKLKCKKFKIERHLSEAAETLEKLKVRQRNRTKSDSSAPGGKKYEEFEEELELQRELAINREQELESLRLEYQNNLDTIEELEKSLNDMPEEVIEESTEYKCLQSQFSVLYNDTILIKDQIEEYHAHIQTLNATFANKMEMTETEDLMTLRKLQTDLLQMQQVNSQLRREYQVLKIEFERNLVANEQTGPLNKEMRHLLSRLQKHNKHLKHEAQRYKRKYKELSAELNLLSKQCYTDSKFKIEPEGSNGSDLDETDFGFDVNDDFNDAPVKEESADVKNEKLDSGYDDLMDSSLSLYDRPIVAIAIKQESDMSSPESPPPVPGPSRTCSKISKKRQRDALQECREALSRSNKELQEFLEVEELDNEKLFEDEYVQDLKSQLKKAETEQKELKLLLDMYKGINRDKREKHQLLLAEKKLKSDIEDTKTQMRRILEIKRENRKKLADEDALRKIKHLEEQNFLLLRQINVHKQEEEALLSEMEVTNQAFEDMQEQNSRLIQQLREKDDANSKLMAERIKSNLLYKITREEKESLQTLISATAKQLDSVSTVMNELEEKEQVYQTAINNLEKEINLRQQALELHRKKAMEQAQCASELKINFEKYLTEVKDARQQISETSSACDAETFKCNRLQEEISILRRKVERMKKIETPETPDIVLVEEVREYKEMLTCQSCKVRRKDAVLTKCFHVFCWECLRTRYETRQRKCPKCNATFGANDYHRLFFAN